MDVGDCKGGERAVWEYHSVTLQRVPGYGFGIAVSGGRDNPHFSNGDVSIAISDVLKAGPAEGKLQINDRVVSANGISLENVDYSTAVQVLRDSGSAVNLVIKRKVVVPGSTPEPQILKVTLTRNKKKDDFGIQLGCRIYIKEITNKSVVEKEAGIHEGDILAKINNVPTDSMTLKEAKKLLDNSKDKLQLVLRREMPRQSPTPTNGNAINTTVDPRRISTQLYDSALNDRQYPNQNLYVQPPTRNDMYRQSNLNEQNEDKNNLTRMSGRSRGPILDISLSQLDQPATPLLHGHAHSRVPLGSEEEEPPPRPPPPILEENNHRPDSPSRLHNDFYGTRREMFDDDPLLRRNKSGFLPDPRFVSFQKEGNVGIRLTGGNETGIFITAVQPGSAASLQGLQPGDKILKVNDKEMKSVTREEAFTYLQRITDRIDLIVQYRRDEYDSIVASQRGDSFYVRAHFCHENPVKGEMSFRSGDVFHVIDTLYGGAIGTWQAFRIGINNQETQKGSIPNQARAEELATQQFNNAKKELVVESSRGSFFKRRSAKRSKSLSKEHWDDVVFSDGASKFPAYERVTIKHPGFTRPVILHGPLADVVRDRLVRESPDKFASPQVQNQLGDISKTQKTSGIVRLSAIKEIIERGKHAILDIAPNTVDRLNYAQFYPIVIFMKADSKHVIKELRRKVAKTSHKSSKKLYDQSVKLEKMWSHIYTATITLSNTDTYFRKIKEIIEKQQQQPIWMSEAKPDEPITDDFLFPMTSRLSYASSPESDLDLTNDMHPRTSNAHSPMMDRRMVKASSDPSIATQEDATAGLPGYHGPPPYSATNYRPDFDGRPYSDYIPDPSKRRFNDENRYYSQANGTTEENRNDYYGSQGRPSLEPYNSLTHSDRFGSRVNGDSESYLGKPRMSAEPESPPKVDRASKPARLRSAQERLFGGMENGEVNVNGNTPNYINTKSGSVDRTNERHAGYESSPYGSDTHLKYPVSPNENRDRYGQQAASNRSAHDPYRFTRSTAQPIRGQNQNPNPNERPNKMPEVSPAKSRTMDYQPVPPAKSQNYKPVPPPKPKNYRSPMSPMNSDNYWTIRGNDNPDEMRKMEGSLTRKSEISPSRLLPPDYRMQPPPPPVYTVKSYSIMDPPGAPSSTITEQSVNSKSRYDDDSGGFDSGQGSSLDRNYDSRPYTKPTSPTKAGGYYYNVPPPRDLGYHTREPSGLDLSNRENRGSAFELYKKPESRSPQGYPAPISLGGDLIK
ncbi:hypothetical protein CHUAL_010327 [Chamberlinius hualienensis]